MGKQLKKGFTLIEIIIVVIIIGILAAVALPRFVSQVNLSKAAEAYNVLGSVMKAINTCVETSGTENPQGQCDTPARIGVTLPATSPNFTYVFTAGNCTTLACTSTATLIGGAAADVITFTYTTASGVVTKNKGGIFATLKN